MCCLLRFPGLVYKYTTSLHSLSTSLPSNKTFKLPLTPYRPFFFFRKAQKMAMILDAFMSKCCTLLTDYVQEEVTTLLGVKEELKKLLQRMRSIQSLLKDAEKRKFDESSIDLWLFDLKDFMYDAEDIIDLCRIEGAQLLADQNPNFKTSPELEFIDNDMETLPGWLLMLLQQRGLKNDSYENFVLNLHCSVNAFRGCIKGGSHWDIIKHIPKVIAKTINEENYLLYIKQPYVYDTNL